MNASRPWLFVLFTILIILLILPVTRAQNVQVGKVECHDGSRPLAWAPNGAWVAFSGHTPEGNGVYWLDTANRRLNPLVTASASTTVLSWSPVSAYIAYMTQTAAGDSEIYISDVTAGSVSHITGDVPTEQITGALVAQNWSAIVFGSDRHSVGDIYVWRTNGETDQITNDLAEEIPLALSPDGNWLVFSRADETGLYVVDLQDGFIEEVSSDFQPAIQPTWSPDGTQFMFARANGDVVLVNGDGSGAYTLVGNTNFSSFHGWSPDGRRLLFTAPGESGSDLYRVSTWSGNITRLTNTATPEIAPQWLPDSHHVLYTAADGGDEDILVSYIYSSEVVNLTNNTVADTRFGVSPDGSRIIFANREGGRYDSDYYVVNTSGGTPQKFFAYAGPSNLAWSPDGQKVAACLSGGATLTTTIQILNVGA